MRRALAQATLAVLSAAIVFAQQPAIAAFEVASIKPCTAEAGFKGAAARSGARPQTSPGRLSTGCMTVSGLVRAAYVLYASGRLVRDPSNAPVEGGPAWIRTDSYQIDARAEGAPSEGVMFGPMLQRLLHDRFALKVHSETREVPVYNLVVAKGGAKLTPFRSGSCVPAASPFSPATALAEGEKPCRMMVGRANGGDTTLEAEGLTLGDFARLLPLSLDRPVMDRTGIQGRFDFHLEYADDGLMVAVGGDPSLPRPAASEAPAGASIFEAIRRYGLKLESGKGPRSFYVIDGIERPSAN